MPAFSRKKRIRRQRRGREGTSAVRPVFISIISVPLAGPSILRRGMAASFAVKLGKWVLIPE
jgi:hypothetical protein